MDGSIRNPEICFLNHEIGLLGMPSDCIRAVFICAESEASALGIPSDVDVVFVLDTNMIERVNFFRKQSPYGQSLKFPLLNKAYVRDGSVVERTFIESRMLKSRLHDTKVVFDYGVSVACMNGEVLMDQDGMLSRLRSDACFLFGHRKREVIKELVGWLENSFKFDGPATGDDGDKLTRLIRPLLAAGAVISYFQGRSPSNRFALWRSAIITDECLKNSLELAWGWNSKVDHKFYSHLESLGSALNVAQSELGSRSEFLPGRYDYWISSARDIYHSERKYAAIVPLVLLAKNLIRRTKVFGRKRKVVLEPVYEFLDHAGFELHDHAAVASTEIHNTELFRKVSLHVGEKI